MVQPQKCSNDIVKIVHVWFNLNVMKQWEYFLQAKTNKNNIEQSILLPASLLRDSRKHHNACM